MWVITTPFSPRSTAKGPTDNFPGTISLSKPLALADDVRVVLRLIAEASNTTLSMRTAGLEADEYRHGTHHELQ